MIVSVSLGDFYYWRHKFNIKSELEYLKIVKKLNIDGIEIHTTEKEILNNEVLRFKHKLNNFFATVHLPVFKESNEFYNKLRDIKKELKVHYFIIHANDFNRLKYPPNNIPFLIENTDKRKKKFRNTKELLKFKQDFCFDIDHSEEIFKTPNLIKRQYNAIKDRIKEFHISTIHNSDYNKYKFHTYHKLITGSGKFIPKYLNTTNNFVIEGVIPINRLDLLKKEIQFIKSFNKIKSNQRIKSRLLRSERNNKPIC